MLVIYIAGPFRGPDRYAEVKNIRAAEALAWSVWAAGMVAISPHLNTANFQGSLPDQVWLEGDIAILRKCDAVLLVPSWRTSQGARHEVDVAYEYHVPVFESLEGLQAWERQRTHDRLWEQAQAGEGIQ